MTELTLTIPGSVRSKKNSKQIIMVKGRAGTNKMAKTLAWFSLILILATLFFLIFSAGESEPYKPDRAWIIERHKYHGIEVSIYEPGVGHYFVRNGLKCKL